MGKYIPKLEIKPYHDSSDPERKLDNLTMNDYGIYLDGQEVRGLRSLRIYMEDRDINLVEMEFAAELEIDIEGLIELAAEVNKVKDTKTQTTIEARHKGGARPIQINREHS